jgi:hypothetical protein
LGEGEWTILDQKDYYLLSNLKWGIEGKRDKFYAVCNIKIEPGRTKLLSLHRAIMDVPKGLLVDHKNGNPLDNRRANLRLATHTQNMHNRKKIKTKTSSQYIGASLDKRSGRWASKIRCHGKKVHLGCFGSDIEAAKAYDAAARKYHGEFARLNFPPPPFCFVKRDAGVFATLREFARLNFPETADSASGSPVARPK